MLAIFVGIRIEQVAVERRIEVLERRNLEGYPLVLGSSSGKPVLLCRTGFGEARGTGAARAVLREYSPSAIVSGRLAGSVPGDMGIGELVLCPRTHLCRAGEKPLMGSGEADRRLLAIAEQAARAARSRYTVADGLTAASPVAEPQYRERVRSKVRVAVVDTEGYWLEEAAREKRIPFLAVRVALGRAFDRAPESLNLAAARGAVDPWRFVAYCLRRPARVPALLSFTMSLRRASQSLSGFMRDFLAEWGLETWGP